MTTIRSALAEAEANIENAARMLSDARQPYEKLLQDMPSIDHDDHAAELAESCRNLYDVAINAILEIRQLANADEPALATMVREIHTAVTANLADETPAAEPHDTPETPYAVRVYYGDDTMEEIHNITGVQVANHRDRTFPIGFLPPTDGADPVPGTFNTETGDFEPLQNSDRIGW